MSAGEGVAPPPGLGQLAAQELVRAGSVSGAVVGVGIDAVDLDRFRGVLGRRAQLVDRLFTERERAYARAASDPVPRLSTRFAAKEATMKALGVGLGALRFTEVEVVRLDLGAPTLVLHGSALERAGRSGVARWHLSLTHTDQVALALVIAEGGAAAGGPADPGAAAGRAPTP